MLRMAPGSTLSEVRALRAPRMYMYAETRGPGGQGCLGVVPESASIANRVFASFLARQPPARSDPLPPQPTRLEDALQRLADIVNDPEIASRDASSPMAFTCVSPAIVRRRTQIYAQAAAGHRGAFSPLDNHGRPKRKYVVQNSFYRFNNNNNNNNKPGCPCHLTDPRRAIRDSDTQNGYRKSGSRLTEIGCPTQVCED